MNQLCKNLESENWNEIYREKDAHDAYNIFYSELFKWYNKSIPFLKPRNKQNINGQKIPWITKGILKSRKTKNKLYKKYKKKPN